MNKMNLVRFYFGHDLGLYRRIAADFFGLNDFTIRRWNANKIPFFDVFQRYGVNS